MNRNSWLILIVSTLLTAIGLSETEFTDFVVLVGFSFLLTLSVLLIEAWISRVIDKKQENEI